MPIYAYRCDACGFAKDVLQKMSDAQLTVCPTCQKDTFKKQVTAAGFQLKGTGWYVTDFRGGAATGGSEKGADATPSGNIEGTPAAAPAAASPNSESGASSASSTSGGAAITTTAPASAATSKVSSPAAT